MTNDKIKLISRRAALAGLGAMSAFSLGGCRSRRDDDKNKENLTRPGGTSRDGTYRESPYKTIGVIGGLGPQATMDFETRVHKIAQRLIPQRQNSGYPPMVVYYFRHPPVLVHEDGSPLLPIRPDPRLLDAARQVGASADFLVITANGPHLLQKQIEAAAGCRVLSMIGVTLEDVRRRQWRKVGVLGFGDPVVYTGPLGELNIECETIAGELRASLDRAIMLVMEGRNDVESSRAAQAAVAALRARQVEGIILGCTEIPLLLNDRAAEADLINPAQLLAEATVTYAVG